MKDNKNNKTNSEVISDLNVRIYGETAIATYNGTYDSVYHGEPRARTILSSDTFVKQDGLWKQVASHSSELTHLQLWGGSRGVTLPTTAP